MRCPICRKQVQPGAPQAPFCSERCKLIDLAKWADEKYRIPAKPEEGSEDQPERKPDERGE